MKKNLEKELRELLRGVPPEDVLSLAESLYSQAKAEIMQGKVYSQEDIRRINDARKSIARSKKNLGSE